MLVCGVLRLNLRVPPRRDPASDRIEWHYCFYSSFWRFQHFLILSYGEVLLLWLPVEANRFYSGAWLNYCCLPQGTFFSLHIKHNLGEPQNMCGLPTCWPRVLTLQVLGCYHPLACPDVRIVPYKPGLKALLVANHFPEIQALRWASTQSQLNCETSQGPMLYPHHTQHVLCSGFLSIRAFPALKRTADLTSQIMHKQDLHKG